MNYLQWTAVLCLAVAGAAVIIAALPIVLIRCARLIAYGWAQGKQAFDRDSETQEKRNRDNGAK